MTFDALKVCIVGQHASMKFGGEASFSFLEFKFLRQRGIDVRMVVHARTRDELRAAFPEDFDRIHFVDDTAADRGLYRMGRFLPGDLDSLTLAVFRHYLVQRRQRAVIRDLVQQGEVNVIHENTPVSPKQISALHNLGAPLVIGPLSGGMEFPPAFRYRQGRSRVWVQRFSRAVSGLCSSLVPGKKKAEVLLVANQMTVEALPRGYRGRVVMMPEIAVDLSLWKDSGEANRSDGIIKLVYLGRLVNWKAVDLLIEAFSRVCAQLPNVTLQLLGDGSERPVLVQQAQKLGIADKVEFAGYVPPAEGARRMRDADIFVLPSLRECGGMVMLEAMAVGLPVVAANWAGPAVHITDETGIRVDPSSREAYVAGLTEAIVRLARSPELRQQMGAAGKRRVQMDDYNWSGKIDRLLTIFSQTVKEYNATRP